MDMDWLTTLLHSMPRFDLPDFQRQPSTLLAPTWEAYMTTLASWSAVVGVVALVGLFLILVVWSIHCCANDSTTRGKSAGRLSCSLFLLCLVCFVCLGVALFGNERVNRGVNRLTHELGSVLDGMDDVTRRLDVVSDSTTSLTANVDAVRAMVDGTPVNETERDALETHLAAVEVGAEEVQRQTAYVNETIARVSAAFHPVLEIVTRIEFERWICFASLFAIMIIVLFASSIGFCRHSKKAAVIFSGLGLVVYTLGVVLLALCLPLTIALADMCMSVRPIVDARLPHDNASQLLAVFYLDCAMPEGTPSSVKDALERWAELGARMNEEVGDAQRLVEEMYPGKEEIATLMSSERTLATSLSRAESVVTSHMECSAYSSQYTRINTAACSTTIGGMGLLLVGLVAFNLTVFVLLLVVGRAWHLYSRRSLDYVEVDEQDPFMPRQAAVPIDIYGSHVYNQRSRLGTEGGEGEARTDEVYDHYS